jgi:hypothetical protein
MSQILISSFLRIIAWKTLSKKSVPHKYVELLYQLKEKKLSGKCWILNCEHSKVKTSLEELMKDWKATDQNAKSGWHWGGTNNLFLTMRSIEYFLMPTHRMF